jgi:hypothetical protein
VLDDEVQVLDDDLNDRLRKAIANSKGIHKGESSSQEKRRWRGGWRKRKVEVEEMITCVKCHAKIDSIAEMGDHLAKDGHQDCRTADRISLPFEVGVLLRAAAMRCI